MTIASPPWSEEISALQAKAAVRHVRSAAGVREFHAPVGTPIVAHPDLPTPHVDARHTQGQTISNFTHPVTGHTMGKTEVGDTYEQLFKAKMAKELNSRYGCCLRLITGAGSGTNRTTPLDFSVGDQGGEVKTLSSLSKNQKTAIKSAEVARKLAAVAEHGWSPLLIVQVVDQHSGNVSVYLYPGFESKAVKKMTLVGTYHYAPADFQRAQRNSGHWDKATGRAEAEAAKQGAEKKNDTPAQLGKLGMRYDPPDEEGGVIEPGDTVIELHQVGNKLVPFIFTHPDEDIEVKLFGRGKSSGSGPDKVASESGVRRYHAPVGTPIVAHSAVKRAWKAGTGGYESVPGKSRKASYRSTILSDNNGKITARGGKEQGFRYEGTAGPHGQIVKGDGFKSMAEAQAAAEVELEKLTPAPQPSRKTPEVPEAPHPRDVVAGAPAAPSRPPTPSTSSASSGPTRPSPAPPSSSGSPTGPDIPRDQWGGPGAQSGQDAVTPDGKAIPPRKPPGRWAKLIEERGNGKGFFGKVTADEYAQGLKEGAFDSYAPTYKASWVDADGVLSPVSQHDLIPGGLDEAAAAGGIRTIITTKSPGKTALTPPIQLVLQFEQRPTKNQVSALQTLMEQLDIQHATISFNVGMVHWEQMAAERRSEGGGLKRGNHVIEGRDLILKFLSDPTKTPEEHAKATGRTVASQFLRGGEGVFDPEAAPGSRALTGSKDDELDEVEARLADMATLDEMLGGLEAKLTRHVRTAAGVRLYDEPVGSLITPRARPRVRPSLDDGSDLHPTSYPRKPLSQHQTRPAYINPREFDDFLDMVDPQLAEKWKAESGPGGYADLWAWVITLPDEDQQAVVQATARMLEVMRQQGKGWLVDLEGKSAVRHVRTGERSMSGGVLDRLTEAMERREERAAGEQVEFKADVIRHVRTPGGRERYDQEIGAVIHPDLPDLPTRSLIRPVPIGTLGSSLLNPENAPPKVKDKVARAMIAINRVHGLGGTTVRQGLPMDVLKARGKDGALVIEGSFVRRIVIRPGAPFAAMTTAHEYGHLLDFTALGVQRHWWQSAELAMPQDNTPWSRFHEAVRESEGSKRLFRRYELELLHPDGRVTTTGGSLSRSSKQYFAQSHEEFARAYAQWIATRSQDETMLAELRKIQAEDAKPIDKGSGVKNSLTFHGQWDDDDFEPIAAALDDIFREQGWME